MTTRRSSPRRASVAARLLPLALSLLTTMVTMTTLSAPNASAEPLKPSQLVQTWTHSSGAQVFLVEKHDLPYVTWSVTLKTGGLWDPTGKTGLASLTAEMLPRGAEGRPREAIEGDLDRLGADFDVSTGRLSTRLHGDAIKRNLDPVMDIVADMLLRPTFPAEELEKLKRLKSAEIVRIRDNDQALNGRFFRRYLFGAHPYGQPPEGTLIGLRAIAHTDVQSWWKAHVVADNVIFGFAGDLTRQEADALLNQHFSGLASGKAPEVQLPELPHTTGRQVLLVDKPERTQNQILIGHPAPTVDSPDRFALEVANTLFGGTFTARLNHEVRDERGLSYGAYSTLSSDIFGGTFTIWTYPAAEDAMKTVGLLFELFEQLRAQPLSAEEVEATKAYLINSFAFHIDTPADLLDQAIGLTLDRRPLTELDEYIDRIRAVTPKEATAAIEKHLDPANFLLVMLCTAGGFEEPMRQLPGVTTVKVVPHDAEF